MALKGVELEITDGITEHSSRVALKGVFSNFGDVVACWVPPIDRRHRDNASVRFGAAASAEAAKLACDSGQVFLQGMQVKVQWRQGGGRRVGNSDLGSDAANEDMRNARDRGGQLSLRDNERRRRSASRDRRRRSRSRRRSQPRRDRPEKIRDDPGDAPSALPDWLKGAEAPAALPPALTPALPGVPTPGASGLHPGALLGAVPPTGGIGGLGALLGADAAQVPLFDPEEEARRKRDVEAKKRERAAQMKRGPGVAALVQDALKRARAQPATQKPADPVKDAATVIGARKAADNVVESDEESDSEQRQKREEQERQRTKEKEEADRLARQRAEVEAKEREKAEQEARERKERARKEAAEAERALQKREAETREQRIKASVEAAKRQQAERAAAKAAREAADSLYDNMPQPDIASEKQKAEERMAEAMQREKQNNLANLPPEDRTKVVFLDIDGVLRPARAGGFDILSTDEGVKVDTSDFFPSAVKALRHIMERTGAVVVLSSEWRRSESMCNALMDVFEKNRLRRWAFATTTSMDLEPGGDPLRQFADRRAREISHWVQENEKDLKGWVVLDDINIAIADDAKKVAQPKKDALASHLVQTWPLCGLTMGNAKTAVRILNGEMINKVVVERPNAPGAGGAAAPGAAARSTTGAAPAQGSGRAR